MSSAAACLGLIATFSILWGQTQPGQHGREARTYEEFDEYLEVVEAQAAEAQIRSAAKFKQRNPESQLLIYVYEYELEAHRRLHDFSNAETAARKALTLAPNNTKVLLALAQILSEKPSLTEENLVEVRSLVEQCQDGLVRIKVPRSVPLRQWDELRATMESAAHAAYGLAAARMNHVETGIREFESAVSLNPTPDGLHYYYLGRLYVAAKRTHDAHTMFSRAIDLGPDKVRQLASEARSTLP